jgi:hypothetical protein
MIDILSEHILLIGIIAGLLQLLGYAFYILNDDIDPNPITWFMFAYGTGLLTILEWDKDATLPELILPTICSILAIYVSYRCWKTARKIDPMRWWPRDWWPDDVWERWSFISDIFITCAYIAAWGLTISTLISSESKELAVFMFLFLSNLSTFPSFYPILKTTYENPEREAALPWFIWTLAYAALGIVTYIAQGEFWTILMFYPLSNVLLHGLVAVFAARTVK